jgi:hypothetical protein
LRLRPALLSGPRFAPAALFAVTALCAAAPAFATDAPAAQAPPVSVQAPPAARPSAAVPQVIPAEEEPVSEDDARLARPFVLSAQLGLNSLAGAGLAASLMVTRHLALEAGLGLGLSGGKIGARARWNFTTSTWAPFAAAGVIHATGIDQPVEFKSDNDLFHYKVGKATWLQLAGGLDGQGPGDHWAVRFEGGWAVPLEDDGLQVIDGNPTSDDWKAVKLVTRGKLVLGASIGYAF